ATPGRLIDLVKRKAIDLKKVKYLILDEADEMLKMGFREDIDFVLDQIQDQEKSTWLFSATLPSEIKRIVKKYMSDDVSEVKVSSGLETNVNIDHQYMVMRANEKNGVLSRIIDASPNFFGIVFCRTKLGTQKLANELVAEGYKADAIHGDLSQNQRDMVMSQFKKKRVHLLIATDVAARGIDVSNVTHVIHYNLPDNSEYYTHRSGRTARAGNKGVSIALCTSNERTALLRFARALKIDVNRTEPPTYDSLLNQRIEAKADSIKNLEISAKFKADCKDEWIESFEGIERSELVLKLIQMEYDALSQQVAREKAERSAPRERGDRDRGGRKDRSDRGDRSRNKRDREDRDDRKSRRSEGGPERPGRDRAERSDRRDRSDRRERSSEHSSSRGGGGVQFYINIGSRDHIDKSDLAAFLHEEGGIPQKDISNIKLNSNYSLFSVEEKASKKIASRFADIEVNGRPLKVKRDEPGGRDGDSDYREKRSKRPKDKKRKKR
ncbi:MAG: DEAD/DEAH box helicase, partial [Flavobacteriales bacterium]